MLSDKEVVVRLNELALILDTWDQLDLSEKHLKAAAEACRGFAEVRRWTSTYDHSIIEEYLEQI